MNCSICKRETPKEFKEEHHLIPRQLGRRNKYANLPVKETLTVCSSCGDFLHKKFSLKELAERYNTLKAFLENLDVQKWIGWIQKRPNDFSICTKLKKRK
jgi:hypothetical protein